MGAAQQGIDSARWAVIPRTLCFILNGDDVLLMQRGLHKKAFPGRYNGIGGHVERDEDAYTSALREINEETGLTVRDLTLRGTMHIDAGQQTGILLFIFTATSDTRAVTDCDEGTLHWIALDNVHTLPLVDDLPLLIGRLFGAERGTEPFFAHVSYDTHDQRVTRFANA
jgi:8-oxo-dGTP diphosphatase